MWRSYLPKGRRSPLAVTEGVRAASVAHRHDVMHPPAALLEVLWPSLCLMDKCLRKPHLASISLGVRVTRDGKAHYRIGDDSRIQGLLWLCMALLREHACVIPLR